jgi:hypothetical protein
MARRDLPGPFPSGAIRGARAVVSPSLLSFQDASAVRFPHRLAAQRGLVNWNFCEVTNDCFKATFTHRELPGQTGRG